MCPILSYPIYPSYPSLLSSWRAHFNRRTPRDDLLVVISSLNQLNLSVSVEHNSASYPILSYPIYPILSYPIHPILSYLCPILLSLLSTAQPPPERSCFSPSTLGRVTAAPGSLPCRRVGAHRAILNNSFGAKAGIPLVGPKVDPRAGGAGHQMTLLRKQRIGLHHVA